MKTNWRTNCRCLFRKNVHQYRFKYIIYKKMNKINFTGKCHTHASNVSNTFKPLLNEGLPVFTTALKIHDWVKSNSFIQQLLPQYFYTRSVKSKDNKRKNQIKNKIEIAVSVFCKLVGNVDKRKRKNCNILIKKIIKQKPD